MSRLRRVVAITGMPGAQKTELARQLANRSGAPLGSLSAVIHAEIERQRQEAAPVVYRRTASALRRAHGDDVLVRRLLALYPTAEPFLIVDGVRTLAEAAAIRASADRTAIVALFAARELRFERMRGNSGPELQEDADLIAQDEENLALGVGDVAVLSDLFVVWDRSGPPLRTLADTLLARLTDVLELA